MDHVHLEFDWGDESLAAVPMGPSLYQLETISAFVPLARGDLVAVHPGTGMITQVRQLAPVYVIEAFFKLNTSDATVAEKIRQWGRATHVQQTTRLTVRVNAESLQWLRDTIAADPKITMIELVRDPSQPFSLADAIAGANDGDEREDESTPTDKFATGVPVDIDEKASSLARILTTWQLAAENGMPSLVLAHQLEIVHRVSGELIKLLPEVEPGTRIHIDPRLPDAVAELMADLYSEDDSEIPDAPPDWLL